MILDFARQPVSIDRGGIVSTTTGWLAPEHADASGLVPAKVYLEGAQGLLQAGDLVTVAGVGYVVESVAYWAPGDIEAVLAAVQLLDICRIERRTARTYTEATNTVADAWSVVWSGPCDVQPALSTVGRRLDNAADPVTVTVATATVPASVVAVAPLDALVVTASRDARLVGRRLVVTGVRMATNPVLRTLLLEEAS